MRQIAALVLSYMERSKRGRVEGFQRAAHISIGGFKLEARSGEIKIKMGQVTVNARSILAATQKNHGAWRTLQENFDTVTPMQLIPYRRKRCVRQCKCLKI